ncbi:MAG: bifunctional folylpolyglutamate synthase/dihydrofolate synthase [Proteobacteria bacterium]|nr:bifunctional folylpolyglutamate synthase/dihydrofolate synthase [Pseudomonadota bacterium]
MNYHETLDYLFERLPMYQRNGQAAYKASLDNTWALDDYFRHPHERYPSVHIAGTNGKGSVAHSMASVLQSSGLKVGLYTKPHLRDFRERIKINGEPISKEDMVRFVADHRAVVESIQPSFFEITVAMALDHFAGQEVDMAVVEVGLGGRLDSTNIIRPLVSVVTNISLDHTNLLGTTLPLIAKEKAGIIKPKVPVVVGERKPETADVFADTARAMGSGICFADDVYSIAGGKLAEDHRLLDVLKNGDVFLSGLKLDLLGEYQLKNVPTAICALEELRDQGIDISPASLKHGLENVVKQTGLMGRWQILRESPRVICDTGHNEAGIREIVNQLKTTAYKKLHLVFGTVDDKNMDAILGLLPKNAEYYFTNANIPRAMKAEILRKKAEPFGLTGETYSSVAGALEQAIDRAEPDDLVFVGGTTFVVAEVV